MEIVKAYEPRPVQVNGVTYLVQELITLEDGQEKRTTKCLGRESDFVKPGGHIIPASFYESSWATTEASLCHLEDDSGSDPTDRNESPQENVSEGLSLARPGLAVGAVVHHKLNRELVGRIVSLDTDHAQIELLSWPTDWWRQWGTRPVPVLVENLELAE